MRGRQERERHGQVNARLEAVLVNIQEAMDQLGFALEVTVSHVLESEHFAPKASG